MESKIVYKNKSYELTDDFIDVGYMAENFEAQSFQGDTLEVRRSNPKKSMSIFVSAPFADESLAKLDELLSHIEVDLECYFVFEKYEQSLDAFQKNLKKFQIVFDKFDEFGPMYGVKIIEGDLENKLAKALFLISKDGAIFYIDFLQDQEAEFDMERLRVELNKAYITYTGVGCHG
jgi:peroxiredoxin